jgi:hypothetical protein
MFLKKRIKTFYIILKFFKIFFICLAIIITILLFIFCQSILTEVPAFLFCNSKQGLHILEMNKIFFESIESFPHVNILQNNIILNKKNDFFYNHLFNINNNLIFNDNFNINNHLIFNDNFNINNNLIFNDNRNINNHLIFNDNLIMNMVIIRKNRRPPEWPPNTKLYPYYDNKYFKI